MTNLAGRLVHATKFMIIYKALTQINSMLATVVLVRLLSEHDYGVYSLFYSLISIFGLFVSFGLINTLQRFIPEYYSRNEFLIAHRLYRIVSTIRFLSNFLSLGVILLYWDYLSPLLKINGYRNYFYVFALIVIIHFQWGLTATCLSSYFQQKYSQSLAALFMALKLIGYGYVMLTYKSLYATFVAELIAYLVLLAGLQITYYNKIPVHAGKLESIGRKEKKRLVRYAFFYNFNDAGSSILTPDFDNFIIVMYLDPIAVGAYAFCQRVAKTLEHVFPVTYLLDIVRPAFITVGLNSSQARITLIFQILIKITYIVTIPLFVCVFLLGRDMTLLFFDGKFMEYSQLLSAVFFFVMLNAFESPLSLTAMLKERADIMLYSKIFALYNIIADILLIQNFGIWGAVIATGTATFGKNIFIWYFVRSEASFDGMGMFFITLVLFWAATGTIVWGMCNMLTLNHAEHFVLAFILVAMCFVLQFKFGLLSANEAGIIRDIFSKNPRLKPLLRLILNNK